MHKHIPILIPILIIFAVALFIFGLNNHSQVATYQQATLNNTTNNSTHNIYNTTPSQIILTIQELEINPTIQSKKEHKLF